MNTHCDTTQGGRLLFARAVPQDLPEMAELEKLCFDDPWTLGMLEEGLSSAWSLALVCRNPEGVLVGSALGQHVAGEAELHSLAIHPDYRGRAWGHRLLEAFLDVCRHANAEVVYLDVREGNQPALALYRKVGFTLDGRRRAYYANGEDALMMSLLLDR